MCGILAYAGTKSPDIESGLKRLMHRGPDASGLWRGEGVALGHRRLSVIDVAARSDQPMESASGRCRIAFNGEIYNYRELRDALAADGVRFRTEGDTEVILEGYERYGISFFDRMRGMWAFVIHDREAGELIAARDPFGIKPLSYALGEDGIFFTSELRALAGLVQLEPDPSGYHAFYTFGYFIAPATPYRGIFKLLPGEVAAWDMKARKLESLARISRFSGTPPPLHSRTEALEYLDTVLTDSVEAHYVADVPVSMLLSGGTDSSLIAVLSKKLGRRPAAYHVAVAGSEDTRYAEAVARALDFNLVVEPLSPEALAVQYEKVWGIIDEPTGDLSIIPTSLVFETIKGASKVVLSGEGGDELFGGYLRHRTLAQHQAVKERDAANAFLNALRAGGNRGISGWNPLVERLRTRVLARGYTDDLVGAYLMSLRMMRDPLWDEELRARLVRLWREDYDPRTPPSLFFDLASYLPDDLLQKSDLSSMASSIEARVPLVDRAVAAAASAAFAAAGMPSGDKGLLKEVLARYLPRDLVYRGKSGFGVPIHSYDSRRFTSDFHAACAFHLAHRDAFSVDGALAGRIESASAREVIARKYPRFAFALISNWKLFGL